MKGKAVREPPLRQIDVESKGSTPLPAKYVLSHRILGPRPRRRLIRRLGDGAVKGDNRVDVVLTERLSPRRHGS